jgi:hypothetical protein
MLVANFGLLKIFGVHSDSGAVYLGLGFGAVLCVAIIWFSRREGTPTVRPIIRRQLLPWGLAFLFCGTVLWLLPEPWKYWGVALIAIGVLYVAAGAIAVLRGHAVAE